MVFYIVQILNSDEIFAYVATYITYFVKCQETAVPNHMHMKSNVFQHVFNYIFTYAYAFVTLSI